MHKFLIPFLITVLFLSCTKKKMEIYSTEITVPTQDRLNKIKFFNTQIGFIVGGVQFSKPTMLKTLDGGVTWLNVTLPSENEKKEIYGLDIFKDGKIITVGYGGTIFISNDTGNTFQYVQHSSWKELKDVGFRNTDTAIIVGGIGFSKGHISEFKTNGSGINQFKEQRNFEISDIDFIDSSISYFSGYGAIMKSIDGGQSWNFTTAKNDFFKAMTWKNSQEGITVGYEGSIQKTSDGGDTWHTIRNGNSITKKKLHFLDVERNYDKTIVAVGEKGCVYISDDDGENWQEANPFTNKDLRGVTFADNQTCFAVGDNGTVFEIKF